MTTAKHPSVIKLAFLTTMCERFGFYVLSFLITLYAKNVFGYSDEAAFALFSIFTALVYIAPPLGGYLADNAFGIGRCIVLGLLIESSGLMLLAVSNYWTFNLALALVAIGSGFFKTGPTHLLGRSYLANDHRIDSGFTLYYIGGNIGPLIAALVIGAIQHAYGLASVFVLGGGVILCGVVFYFWFRHTAKSFDTAPSKRPLTMQHIGLLILGLVLTVLLATYLIAHTNIGELMIITCSVIVLLYFGYQIIISPKEEKLRIMACLVLIFVGMLFFSLYLQLFTSFTLFINRCVDRMILGYEIPTVAYFSLICVYAIIISLAFAKIYLLLGRHNRDLAITTKFALGLLIIASSFFVLVFGISHANALSQVSPWWIVLAYFLITVGEILVNGLGVAMVTRIAPRRMYGIMMGSWFLLSISLATFVAKVFANYSNIPENVHTLPQILQIYQHAFLTIGYIGLAGSILAFILGYFLKKIVMSALKI